jgi:hypothetical protein
LQGGAAFWKTPYRKEMAVKPIQQIIDDALAALTRKRADEAEVAEKEAAEARQKHANKWKPIVEGLKPYIPVELHDCITFTDNTDVEPSRWVHTEFGGGRRYCPVRITLPVPEQYTVFGYFVSAECVGFEAGALCYDDDGNSYFTPTGRYYEKHESEIRESLTFEIALGQTVSDYKPKPPRAAAGETPKVSQAAQVIPLGEQIESLLRMIVREEMSDE